MSSQETATETKVVRERCEYCFHFPAGYRTVNGKSVPLCGHHLRDADRGFSFKGCVSRTMWETLQAIHQDPIADYLIRENQIGTGSSAAAVLATLGDPREWPAYAELKEAGFVPNPRPARPRADGTHPHWAVHQHQWTGEWYIQRGVRNGYGTSYDPPLPGHDGFRTKLEAEKFKKTIPDELL